ncbi:hypothetical protein MHU86_14980 [Fragilaria crotonensis]|nr:hypothetical protein MHU86_14980 [Fragilaria crotonensis]
MTRSRKVLDEGVISAGVQSKKRKHDEVVVSDIIPTRRSARLEKSKLSEEPATREESQGDVEVQPRKGSRNAKAPKDCEDSLVSPRTGKNRALFSDGKLKTNPTPRAILARRSIPRRPALSQESKGPKWTKLDHKMIISDYVYGGNASLPFGDSIQSALSAVESELDKLAPTLETPESIEEEQAYNRSIRSRARLMYSEKAVREKEKLQFEEQLRLFQIQQRNMKKSPEQLEYEEFQIRQICYDGGDEFECDCGIEGCRLCASATDFIPTSEGIIDAPAVRPSNVTDSWREYTIEEEPELTGFGVKGIGAPTSSKRRRTSRRSQRSSSNRCGLMLLEMKHTLAFLDKYNRGY